MTISKGSALTITTGANTAGIAAFSSSQAGVCYTITTFRGFLLDISGTTITKAGSEAVLHTANTGPFQRTTVRRSSSTNLRGICFDSTPQVDVVPITKTATQLSGGTPYTMSWPAALDNSFFNAAYNWDGDTLVVVLNQAQNAWYLSLTDDTTQGNTVTFAPASISTADIPTFAPFTSTSGILVFMAGAGYDFMGVPLTKSGLTLTAGSTFSIDTTDAVINAGDLAAGRVSSSRIVSGYCDTLADRRLATIDSPTTVNSTTVDAASDFVMWLESFHANSVVSFTDNQVGTSFWTEFTVAAGGGLTKTNTLSEAGITGGHARAAMDKLDTSHIIGVFGDSGTTKAIIITTDVSPPAIATDEFTAAPMVSKPCDIDPDGTNIYISAIASDSTPILIQFATALDSDGSVVFEPGSGDNIGVECSRGDADEVTVAGQFDGTNVVERSEDAGTSFSVIDDGTIGGVSAFRVGPDSDNRILVFDEDNSDILETVDEGTTWTSINASVTETIKAIGRLGIDVQQVAFGNSSADAATVTHSMSSGADIEELTGGDDPNSVDITRIIIN